jgi:hypothetical protein
MATHIFIAPKYNHYFKVTSEQFVMLMEMTQWKQEYNDGYRYSPTEESLDVYITDSKALGELKSIEEMSIDTILEENTRLTKENEILQEKLDKFNPILSESTELEPF